MKIYSKTRQSYENLWQSYDKVMKIYGKTRQIYDKDTIKITNSGDSSYLIALILDIVT